MLSHRAVGALCCALLAAAAGAKELVVDAPAPDFQATAADGKTLTLADFHGQVLMLFFWTPHCTPCAKQMAMLDSYYKAQEKAGLRVLAVMGGASPPVERMKVLVAALSIAIADRFKGDYGPGKSVPVNYVIDRFGVLRYAKAGMLTLEDLNTILVPLLREHESPKYPVNRPPGQTLNGS